MQAKKSAHDKVTATILAAFLLMGSTHFACRYDVGSMVDDFFTKVSAETAVSAPVQEPLAAAPAITSELAEPQTQVVNATISRNPFAVPGPAQTIAIPVVRPNSAPAYRPAAPAASAPAASAASASFTTPPATAPAVQAAPVVVDTQPHVRGIVQSGNKSMAIIEYKGSSGAYSAGQTVGGAYTVGAIGSHSVQLNGNGNSHTVNVGG